MVFVVDRKKGDPPGESDDYVRDVSVYNQTTERILCSRLNNFPTGKAELRGAHRDFLDSVVHYYMNKFGNLEKDAFIEIIGRASRRRNDNRRFVNSDLAKSRAVQVDKYLEAVALNSGAKLARRVVEDEGDEESFRNLGDSPNDGRERAVDININAGSKTNIPPPEPGYEKFEITLMGGVTFGAKALGAAYLELLAVLIIKELPDLPGDIKETANEMRYCFISPFGFSFTSVGPKDILPAIAKEWSKLVKPTVSRILRSPPFSFRCSKRRFATDFNGYAQFSIRPGPPPTYKLHAEAPALAPAFTIPTEIGTVVIFKDTPPLEKITIGDWAGALDSNNPPEPFRTIVRNIETGG